MDSKFVYADEKDKCYGLTGMIISLNVLESDDMLREISIDSTHPDSILFTPDFFFCSNPRYSAKIAWKEMVKQYQLLTGLVIGNVLCRYGVGARRRIDRDVLSALKELIADEGRDMCSFDDDEIDEIFSKTYGYLSNVFASGRVHSLADNFVDVLRRRRTMSGSEVLEELQLLNR